MELKFEKRRNHRQIRDSSNRTFMELKSSYDYRLLMDSSVLIVPLWN